ncbi:MAG: hypothetical protein N2578_05380 [Bdellovibrionaceae bacterium]|nr:hypothetical protein [Pseudobdellovibrionaceae bacterium]
MMFSGLTRYFSLVVATAVVVFSFQNCGRGGLEAGDGDGLLSSVESGALQGKTNAPFAFEATYDQITYSSCTSPKGYGRSAYFTLKAGAYSTGGVRLRTEFINAAKALIPRHPSPTVTDEQIKEYLAYSKKNSGIVLQSAIRGVRNFDGYMLTSNATPRSGVDFFNLLYDLSDDRYMHPLVQSYMPLLSSNNPLANFTNYFPHGVQDLRNIETVVAYNKTTSHGQNLRNSFVDADHYGEKLALTLTFNQGGSNHRVFRDSDGKVHGKQYELSFSNSAYPNYTHPTLGLINTGHPTRHNATLAAVTERDIATGSTRAWNCDANRRFIVIRKSDWDANKSLCPAMTYNEVLANQTEIAIARRHLPAGEWHINVVNKCVVPLAVGDCYEVPDNRFRVEYDTTKQCFHPFMTLFGGPATFTGAEICAEFISICLR